MKAKNKENELIRIGYRHFVDKSFFSPSLFHPNQ